MKELQIIGGARIGMANATFPFATLKVTRERLELNASIVGNLTFQPCDIISIEPYTKIPIIGQGIKIEHKVSTYKQNVIFWTFKDPKSVIQKIQETGFFRHQNAKEQKNEDAVIARQAKGGFPIKIGFAIGAIVIWNLLLLPDLFPLFREETDGFQIGNGGKLAIGLMFLTALCSLISEDFRRLILKEGRDLNDIKKFAILAMAISGFMLLQLGFIT